MATKRVLPWDKPPPTRQKGTKLSPAQKAAAKQRATRAGRRYPNLVDNMWAARPSKQ